MLFAGQRSSSDLPGLVTLSVPSLLDLPAERTLWTIEPPLGSQTWRPLLSHSNVTLAKQQEVRRDSWAALVNAPGRQGIAQSAATSARAGGPIEPSTTQGLGDKGFGTRQDGTQIFCAVRGEARTFILRNAGARAISLNRAVFVLVAALLIYAAARRWQLWVEWIVRFPSAPAVAAALLIWWLLNPILGGPLAALLLASVAAIPRWRAYRERSAGGRTIGIAAVDQVLVDSAVS